MILTFKSRLLDERAITTLCLMQLRTRNLVYVRGALTDGANTAVSAWQKWIVYLRFYVPLNTFSLIWRRHHCRWRATKFRPMLGAKSLWAGRDLYCATPAVTRGLMFSGLIRGTAPFSRLLRRTRGYGGIILTRILMGSYQTPKDCILCFIYCTIAILEIALISKVSSSPELKAQVSFSDYPLLICL
jgi:hypothetical protein